MAQAADELYAAPAAEFTKRRTVLAAAARRTGNPALAAEIAKLRRPTAGAWLANRLARMHPDDVEALLTLGERLRQAQRDLAGDDLRRLARERQAAVAALLDRARQAAAAAGLAASPGTLQDVQATLEAASADSASAEVFRAGRLTSALRYSGLGAPDVAAASTPGRRPGRRGARERPSPAGSDAGGRRIEAARQRLDAAAHATAAARDDVGQAKRRLQDAERHVEVVRRDLHRLEEQLRATRLQAEVADQDVTAARRSHAAATRTAQRAESHRDHAREALDRIAD